MKKLFTIWLAGLLYLANSNMTYAQIIYDNGGIGETGAPDARYIVDGRKWSNLNITYMFINGTGDIAGNDERAAVRQAFNLWQGAGCMTFTEVTTEANANIRIFWGADSHGDSYPFDNQNGVLAHAFYPPPTHGALAGDIHFDEDENWTTSTRSGGGQPIDLVTVAAHEIGHALGLGHSTSSSALMYAYYGGSHRYLATDDINGINSIYQGTPPTPEGINGPASIEVASTYTYSVVNPMPGTPYEWVVNPGTIISNQNSSVTIQPGCGSGSTQMSIRVRAKKGCGTSNYFTRFITLNCNFNFSVYPNSTSDQFTIEYISHTTPVEAASEQDIAVSTKSDCFEVSLYDQQSQIINSAISVNGKVQLDVSRAEPGAYVLHILYQGEVYTHNVLVEK